MTRRPELSLRPFFGFYGGKWRDSIKHYPPPRYATIVEPFAGSAGYSTRYPSRDVILYELDPIISAVWEYLINVTAGEIMSIPDVPPDGSVDDLRVCEEAKYLVGFWLNRGASRPRRSPSSWMRQGIRPGSFWGGRVRERIATQVDSIRHWQVFNEDYQEAGNQIATWFIDPPYQVGGSHYTERDIDFENLAEFCRSRRGQVIVCENGDADWLPFKPFASTKGLRKNSSEVVWTNQ